MNRSTTGVISIRRSIITNEVTGNIADGAIIINRAASGSSNSSGAMSIITDEIAGNIADGS